MRARFINEAASSDEMINKIKFFAKENGLKFDINKKGTPSVSMPVYYQSEKGYDQLHWPILVTETAYTFTLTENEHPISLRKIIYGHEPNPRNFWGIDPNSIDLKKAIILIDKMNESIKHLQPRPEQEIEKNKQRIKKEILKSSPEKWIPAAKIEGIILSKEEEEKSLLAILGKEKKKFLQEKNLNQSLMGRFDNIEEALDRVKINIVKERKKK